MAVHPAFASLDGDAGVHTFHRSFMEAGYRDDGASGERPEHPGSYGAYVLDLDGFDVEVVEHHRS